MLTELILVRHGQTDANASGCLQGRIDLPLNDLGRAQAAAIGAALRPVVHAGALVISSPLQRARQTAEALGVDPVIDPDWLEVDYGAYDGMPFSSITPELWDRWRSDPDFTPEGGESMATLGRRIRAACERLAATSEVSTLVVVSHVSPIKSAVAWSLGITVDAGWRMHVDQASITRIGVTSRHPVLRGFNSTEHLALVSEQTARP